ncbi:hypothetical protein [Bdellovibrio sp. HCB337]|uniref:hypothetical protein n=1 Tax=Bdellovibrio sp. HCB337 TaxID=3394358 RepID=UPI0039A52240
METQNEITNILFASLLTILSVGCSKGSSTSDTTTAAATNYYLSNGYCYSSAGQQVSTSYCSSTTGYNQSNGYCYSSSTGQAVNSTYCTSSSTTTGSQCVGVYYYLSAYGYQAVQCNGTNCRGYTLLNQYGLQTYCQ